MDNFFIKPNFIVSENDSELLINIKLSEEEEKAAITATKKISNYSYIFLKSRTEGFESRLNLFTKLLSIYEEDDKKLEDESDNKKIIREMQNIELDLISKVFMTLEDLAYLIESCYEYIKNDKDICKSYLKADNPYNVLQKFTSKNGKNKIKKLFMYPKEQDNLDNIISPLSQSEKEVVWEKIEISIECIFDILETAKSLFNNFKGLYNKYKHGLTQIFPSECDILQIKIPKNKFEKHGSEKIKGYIKNILYKDLFLLNYDDNKIVLERPLNITPKIIENFKINMGNFTEIYRLLNKTYLSWAREEAYLNFVSESKENLFNRELNHKMISKEFYSFD